MNFVSALRSADHTGTPKGSRSGFGSPLTSKNSAEARLKRLRRKVIQEIVKTEQIYVNQLKAIQNEFMEDPDIKLTFSKREHNGKGYTQQVAHILINEIIDFCLAQTGY